MIWLLLQTCKRVGKKDTRLFFCNLDRLNEENCWFWLIIRKCFLTMEVIHRNVCWGNVYMDSLYTVFWWESSHLFVMHDKVASSRYRLDQIARSPYHWDSLKLSYSLLIKDMIIDSWEYCRISYCVIG